MTKWKSKTLQFPPKKACCLSTLSQPQLILSLYSANLPIPQGISSLEKVLLLENVPESHFLKMQTFTPGLYSTMKWNQMKKIGLCKGLLGLFSYLNMPPESISQNSRPLSPRSLLTGFSNVNHTDCGFVLGKITCLGR